MCQGFWPLRIVSKCGGVMEVQYQSRTSLLLVAVDCGQFTHLGLKHKGPLVFDSWGNTRKSESIWSITKNCDIYVVVIIIRAFTDQHCHLCPVSPWITSFSRQQFAELFLVVVSCKEHLEVVWLPGRWSSQNTISSELPRLKLSWTLIDYGWCQSRQEVLLGYHLVKHL